MARKMHKYEAPRKKRDTGLLLALPFFLVMAVLTVAAFIIPLRPTVSVSERRELTKFPEFSLSALTDGSYFDDITTWFSDTFPGREQWITLSEYTTALHGYSEIAIVEDDFVGEILGVQDTTEETIAPPATQEQTDDPGTQETTGSSQEETQESATEETEPQETEWGGIDAGDDAEISMGAVIQIGDSAFNQQGFSEYVSRRYATALSGLADALAGTGVRIISCPAPTAVGVMIESAYQEKLNCYPQDQIIDYLHTNMSENVVTVDTFSSLVTHNDEYIYFRTDHHWTALGAYYAYTALCEAADMEAAALDSFEVWDHGEFRGSLTTKVRYPNKLLSDNVYAYIPQGDITMYTIYDSGPQEAPMLADTTNRTKYEKYLTFLGGDFTLQMIVNESLPEGSTCLIVKDSFGNCFAPFLTQNYHTVYVMDYRAYHKMTVRQFVEEYGVDDVIFAPYLMATQSSDGAAMFERLCK